MTNPEMPNRDSHSGEPAARTTALALFNDHRRHITGRHPENAARLRAIESALESAGLVADRPRLSYERASDAAIARVHTEQYLDHLKEIEAQGGGAWLTPDTPVGPDSFDTARLVSGAVIAAIDAVLSGDARRAFVLGRPPGHHATPDGGMGFCLINHIGVGAAHALANGAERVAVIDWDVHHGNGTQDMFYDSNDVFVCSVHQSPLYPGTGAASERGRGAGEGYTLNLPLPARQDNAVYETVFRDQVLPAVRRFAPDLVLVSAGFDAHRADPIGGMSMTEDGFATLAALVVDLAEDVCDGKVVATLEGGYDPPALSRSVVAVLNVFDGVHDAQHAV
jgi:acetoin utilization deacetylase AcuC-like enzyme